MLERGGLELPYSAHIKFRRKRTTAYGKSRETGDFRINCQSIDKDFFRYYAAASGNGLNISRNRQREETMAVSSIDAGKTLCELSGWRMSNLRLQKALYIAHMYHLGTHDGQPLIKETFEAWMYGPVEPKLYNYCKFYGRKDLPNIFPIGAGVSKDKPEYETLERTTKMIDGISSAKLVGFTHSDKGAWKQIYKDGEYGGPIPNDLIEQEHYVYATKGQ